MEIVAHRGSSFLAPENTLAALKLGWEETMTCELDIRATADGRLVVIHDASTLRTTGSDFVVAEHAWRDLRLLDAGAWKGDRWKGERLPLLEEALDAMAGDRRLFIEIKEGPAIVPELKRVVEGSGKSGQVALQSFSLETCVGAKRDFTDLPVYFLVELKHGSAVAEAIKKAKSSGLDGLNFGNTDLLSDLLVEQVHEANLKVGGWTIDREEEARRCR
jgi:glycerophosphoryl diester phosphodiesterase